MKGQIILHAIGNEGTFSYYIFNKEKKIFLFLSRLFNEVFDAFFDEADLKTINIENIKDSHWSLGQGLRNSRVDVFFGEKRMFFILHCSARDRLKFNNKLFKVCKMPKPHKSYKIKSKKNKK